MYSYSYSFTPPTHSEQIYLEMKESDTLKDSTITKRHIDHQEDIRTRIWYSPKSPDDVKMTSNPAYDVGTTVKMENNPAYSLSDNKVMESDYMWMKSVWYNTETCSFVNLYFITFLIF